MSSAPTTPPVRHRELIHVEQDEILTGEAVALDVQPAGVLLRSLGALIDILVTAALLYLVIWVSANALNTMPNENALRIVVIATIVTLFVIVPTAIETATRGRSLGKLAIGARIVRVDGGAAGVRQAFIRALIGFFETWMTLGVVAFLTGAFTAKSQRLGDLVAGTYAQRTRVAALPAPLPGVPPMLGPWAAVADVARMPDPLARRLTQFLHQRHHMHPGARDRVTEKLLSDVEPYVSPLPPADPVTALLAIAAVRRDREYRALMTEAARVRQVAPALDRLPHGFPER